MATTVVTNLRLALDQASANLVEATASPKPDYGVDGQSVSWSAYVAGQAAFIKETTALLAILDPYVYMTQVR